MSESNLIAKQIRYSCFRYQIIPRNRASNDLFELEISIEQLIEKKNEYFRRAITDKRSAFYVSNRKIQKVLDATDGDDYRFLMNIRRGINLETKDFKRQKAENYPKFNVLIMNSPNDQYLIIEDRAALGTKSEIIAKAILDDVNKYLSVYNLVAECQPMFSAKEFWDLASEYSGSITRARFELITPNMSSISSAMADDFKELAKKSNATKTVVELAADKNMALELNSDNAYQKGLVDYASEGGGNINLTVRGKRTRIPTRPKHKTIEIAENFHIIQGLKEFFKRVKRAVNV